MKNVKARIGSALIVLFVLVALPTIKALNMFSPRKA